MMNMGGASLKAPDYCVMPLCFKCHELFHKGLMNRKLVEMQPEWIVRTLGAAIDDGVLVEGEM